MISDRGVSGQKGCFAVGSKVSLPDGTDTPIENLKSGDRILCFNDVGELVPGTVREVRVHEDEMCREYVFWRRRLKATPSHWVQNQFGDFSEIGNLTTEDAVPTINNHLSPLLGFCPPEQATVVSVITEPFGTMIVEGLRVHNGGLGLPPSLEEIYGEKGGGKGGGGTPRAAVESPNSLVSKSKARLIDLWSEGDVVGLENGAQSIFFDDTPLENEDGSLNFNGVSYEVRTGLPTQDHVTGFPEVESEEPVNTEVLKDQPVVRTISDPDADAVRITLSFPALYTQNITNGDMTDIQVDLALDVKSTGGTFNEVKLVTVKGKNTSEYQESHRLELPSGGSPWQVRVRRLKEDAEKVAYQDRTFFNAYTVIRDVKLSYPDTAYIAMQVDAEQFGDTIPSRQYQIKGIKIQVPSNYDPETREYTGIWNGTFKTAWTNNPAWILYALLTNSRYGVGDRIDADLVDKWGMYTIGQYCDELVDDGFGGMEPRFTFNGVLNSREDAYNVLTSIASVFRGMVYWGAGAVFAAHDGPKDSIKLVNQTSVIGGEFNYSGTSMKSRHSVVMVSWNDPEDGYRPAIMVVEDQESIAQYGWRQMDVVAFGCTSKGQAYRMGKWAIETEKTETEVVSYKASMDHADVRPGDIVDIADPMYAGIRFGGRMVGISDDGLFVTLDAPVTLDGDETFKLSVSLPDGSLEERTVLTVGEELDLIRIASAFSVEPTPGTLWIIYGSNVEPRKFRITNVMENEKNEFQITASYHDYKKYDRIEKGVALDRPNHSIIPTGPLAAPENPDIRETLYKANNSVKTRIILSWTPSNDARVTLYKVEYKSPSNTNWIEHQVTSSTSVEWTDAQAGNWSFRIRALGTAGVGGLGKPTLIEDYAILGKTAPPGNVTGLVAERRVDGVQLSWDEVSDIDLVGYEVRKGDSWEDATVISASMKGTTVFATLNTALVTKFHVRAIDDSGNLSVGVATIETSVIEPDDLVYFNAIRQDSHVSLNWNPVSGTGVEYEIRVGLNWASGRFVTFVAGDKALVLWPGEGETRFWIKARSAASLYSKNAIFSSVLLAPQSSRNVVVGFDEADDGWTGLKNNLEVGDFGLDVIDLGKEAEYYVPIDLGSDLYARNSMGVSLVENSGTPFTWADATYSWDSNEAEGLWINNGDVDYTNLTQKIATYNPPDVPDLLMVGLQDDTDDIGGAIKYLAGDVEYQGARVANGVYVDDALQLGYAKTIPAQFTFTIKAKIDPDDMDDQSEFVYASIVNSATEDFLKVGYNAVRKTFFVRDTYENIVAVDAPVLTEIDHFFLAVVQSSTQRTIYYHQASTDNDDSASEVLAPSGVYDRTFLYDWNA